MNINEKNKTKGFTLIEVIIASMIFVVAVIPIMSSFVVAQQMNVKGRHKEQAMTVAQNIVETVKALGAVTTYDMANTHVANAMGSGSISLDGELSTVDKSKDISINGADKTVTYKDYTYTFKVDSYVMGLTTYDAKVTVSLDDSDAINVEAYYYQGLYNDMVLPVMKYYTVVAEVYPHGTSEIFATYSGTFVTKN